MKKFLAIVVTCLFTSALVTASSVSTPEKGTGLGLYICKKIAEAHKADILMTDNNPQGSIFTIRFSV